MIKQILKFICLCALFLFFSREIPAAENIQNGKYPPPEISLYYYESANNKLDVSSWVIASQWIWNSAYEYNLVATPALRVTLMIPFPFEIPWEDFGVQIITKETNKVIFDIPFYYKKAKVKIKEKGKDTTSLLLFNVTPKQKDFFFVHHSCTGMGLKFTSNALTPPEDLTHVAVTCLQENQNIYINIQHETNWTTFLEKNPQRLKQGRFRGIITYNLEGKDYPKNGEIQDFYILDSNKRKVLEVAIKSDGKIFPKFYFDAGVAPTYINYKETSTNITLDSVLLKIMANAGYLLSPSQYFLTVYGDITPVTFFNSKKDVTRATYSTLDFSVMRKFSAKAELSRNAIGLGWVYWSMNVNSSGWGINYVVGPEFIYSYIKNKPNRKELRASFKVAPLLNGESFGFDNRYLDLQFAYELTKPGTMSPLFIFLQGTNIAFEENTNRKMTYVSGTLGVLKSF